jgi:hypothetical protein
MRPRLLALLVALDPAVNAPPEALGSFARVAVDAPQPVHVVLRRGVGVGSKIAFSAARIVAAEDAVVVATPHPLRELPNAPHGVGMRPLSFGEEAQDAVPARVPFLVLGGLPQEGVEVESLRGDTRGHHHERAAGGERIAAREGSGPVGRQLRRAVPIEQHCGDGAEREPDQRG